MTSNLKSRRRRAGRPRSARHRVIALAVHADVLLGHRAAVRPAEAHARDAGESARRLAWLESSAVHRPGARAGSTVHLPLAGDGQGEAGRSARRGSSSSTRRLAAAVRSTFKREGRLHLFAVPCPCSVTACLSPAEHDAPALAVDASSRAGRRRAATSGTSLGSSEADLDLVLGRRRRHPRRPPPWPYSGAREDVPTPDRACPRAPARARCCTRAAWSRSSCSR